MKSALPLSAPVLETLSDSPMETMAYLLAIASVFLSDCCLSDLGPMSQ